MDDKELGIIFHSGSFDRIYHGLSIALTALALGREARLFFSYWALPYLKKDRAGVFELDKEAGAYRGILEKNIGEGHILKIEELFGQVKKMGAKFYTCTNSMGLLNIARDELGDVVDKSMGITKFLVEVGDGQILFV